MDVLQLTTCAGMALSFLGTPASQCGTLEFVIQDAAQCKVKRAELQNALQVLVNLVEEQIGEPGEHARVVCIPVAATTP